MTPNDGFAKVHYGFILKAQNKIAESIPYLKVTIPAFPLFFHLLIPLSHLDSLDYALSTNWHALRSTFIFRMYTL